MIMATIPRPSLLFAALLLTMGFSAEAASVEPPETFVKRVYARYRSTGPGVLISRPGGDAFYTTALLDAFARDRAGAGSDGVALDWDPICGCQDYDLRLGTVTVTKRGDETADARVAFTNLGSRRSLVLTLSRTQAGWRIADVSDKDVGSIVALLGRAVAHPAPSKASGSTTHKR